MEIDCETSTIIIESTKDISNIVYSIDGEHQKIDDLEGYEYALDLEGIETMWVKSGNNHSGDGPGYGQRFDLDPGACAAVDRDGDGYLPPEDCDDSNPAINPGAVDIPNDGIDQNCDGSDLIVATGALRVTLTWDTDDDLDLFIEEPQPGGETLSYNNPTTTQGGTVDRDDNVGQCGIDTEPGGVENYIWDPTAPTGEYTVSVSSFEDCDPGVLANWTVQVYVNNVLVQTETGTSNLTDGAIVDVFTFTIS